MLNIEVITLHPELFPGPLGASLVGQALGKKIWNLETHNLRDFGLTKHQMVDDRPFGGGAGMVLLPEVLSSVIDNIKSSKEIDDIIYFSPRGNLIKQNDIRKIAQGKNYIFLCGRFEAVDERIIEEYSIKEYSLGDFIMSGGEIACMAMIDACVRLLPGVLSNQESLEEESFGSDPNYENLLEYPQYTRPFIWRDRKVPEILLTGNHQKIKDWRLKKAQIDTELRRPDLFNKMKFKG